ncbi:MAG: UMP kinase [Mollicutes bacterium]|nr:MAG: UMP kinase [Mollicutes bacterium]
MRRCVIKLSGAAFGNRSERFDFVFLNALIKQISELLTHNVEIVLVLGGGNICRGKELKKSLPKIKDTASNFDYAGMLGTVINGLLLQNFFISHGQKTELFSDLLIDEKIVQKYTYKRVNKSLQKHRLSILVGGIGLPNFSTDVATFLKAKELNADIILLGKHRVDGIYSADPHANSEAK